MWHSKFLDLEEDKDSLTSDLKNISEKKKKLTPLEFTILETIYNNKSLSGYDLIQSLNIHFAGTWEAKSGTIYPILSKLKKTGFLDTVRVKTPIGPLKKVYILTESGEKIIKFKVNKDFDEQIKFIKNFIIEFATFYVHSFSEIDEKKKEEKINEVQSVLKEVFKDIIEKIPFRVSHKSICPKCKAEINQKGAEFCPFCGVILEKNTE